MGSLIYIRLIGHTFGTLLLLFWMVAIVGYRRQRNFERVFVARSALASTRRVRGNARAVKKQAMEAGRVAGFLCRLRASRGSADSASLSGSPFRFSRARKIPWA